jgi:hypothetical protein
VLAARIFLLFNMAWADSSDAINDDISLRNVNCGTIGQPIWS